MTLNRTIITLIFFSIIFLIGILSFNDYGASIDDEHYRQNGLLTYEYLKNIDLLISVDTSMTHLAATLQVKTLLLLNSNPDCRWHIEFKEKCFYENLEIIRLNKANDWNSIPSLISLKLREIFK